MAKRVKPEKPIPAYMQKAWYKEHIKQKEKIAARLEKKRDEGYSYKWVRENFLKVAKAAGAIVYRIDHYYQLNAPRYLMVYQGRVCFIEIKGTGQYYGVKCTAEEVAEHARIKSKGVDTYVVWTRIDNINELYTYCYTTYPSRHYKKWPEAQKEVVDAWESDHVKTAYAYE